MSTHPLAHSDSGRPRARRIPRRFSHGTAVSALALALGLSACAGGANSPTAAERDAKSATLLNVADETNAGGDPATAASLYRQLHDMAPKDPVPLGRLAATFMTMQDYRAASQAYRAALALDDGNADFHRGLALALLAMGDAPGAMTEIRAALAKRADDPRLYSLMGVAQDMVGRHDLAQQSYRHGIAIAPASVGLRNNYAMSLALSGDYGEAVTKLAEIAGPQASPRYRLNLALAYGLAGDDAKAAATSREVLDDASVQNNLAYYALLRGMDQERRTAAIIGAELRGAAVSVAETGAQPSPVAIEHPVSAPPPVPVAVAPIPLLPVAQSGPASQLPAERHIAAVDTPTTVTSPAAGGVAEPAPAPLDLQASFTPALQPDPLAFGATVELASDTLDGALGFTPAPLPEATRAPQASAPAPVPKARPAAPVAPTAQIGFVPAVPTQPQDAAPSPDPHTGFTPVPVVPAATRSVASTGSGPQIGFVPAVPLTSAAPEPQIGFTPAPPAMPVLSSAMEPQTGFVPAPLAQPIGNENSGGMTVPQVSSPAPQPTAEAAPTQAAPDTAAVAAEPTMAPQPPSAPPAPPPVAAEAHDAPALAAAPAEPTMVPPSAPPAPQPVATQVHDAPALAAAPAEATMAPQPPSAPPAPQPVAAETHDALAAATIAPPSAPPAPPPVAAMTHDAPALAAAPKPPTVSNAPQSAHATVDRYAVQLGSFQVEDTARKLTDAFTAKGIAVTLSRANGNDGRAWFVVRSRDFDSMDDATTALKMIQSMGGAQPVLVHHRVRAEAGAPAA
jgi:Flp pilus assembly protein TadD